MSKTSNMSRSDILSNNILKGKIAEEIAKADYEKNGFEVIDTGIGSDFKATKRTETEKTYEEYVDVKAGNARLSKRQTKTRNKLKRQGKYYYIYRVPDQYLSNHFQTLGLNNFHGAFVIKNPTSCPHCNTTVDGITSILRIFGLRNMNDGTVRVQSWCKDCRSLDNRPKSISGSRYE